MRYYKENDRIVIRGKHSNGKPYRIFVKDGDKVLTLEKGQRWDRKSQKVTGKNTGSVNAFLVNLGDRLRELVRENKISNPAYGIPEAWSAMFGTVKEGTEKLSDRIVDAIGPYLQEIKGNKSETYLRHFTQLKTELTAWNKDVLFTNLNDISLNGYLHYLKGEGTPARKKLKPSTIAAHFKHLRQVAKYARQRGLKVDPSVFNFNAGKIVFTEGCFDLTFEELMVLWHYKPANKTEEIVLDYSLMEAFTGIRNGDLYSLKPDRTEHGLKCGDINAEYIAYRDRKNYDLVKKVTRHKFNERLIIKYWSEESNRFLLPPIAQQTINRVIKDIAKACNLNRGISRGIDIKPLHEVIASHCFRSSYANILYRQGVTSELVSEELGHAAASVTVRHYLKFSNRHDLIREKMNALEIFQPEEKKSSLKKVV